MPKKQNSKTSQLVKSAFEKQSFSMSRLSRTQSKTSRSSQNTHEFSHYKKPPKELENMKKIIVETLKEHNIKKAGIFGSYVRGEAKKKSDVDVLIEPPRDMSLLRFIHVKHELEDKLHKKIDLVSYRGIHPLLKKQILQEEMKII